MYKLDQTDVIRYINFTKETALKNGYLSVTREACTMVGGLCERLGQVAAQCNADQAHGGGANIDEARFQVSILPYSLARAQQKLI